jgi:hypothetical protein
MDAGSDVAIVRGLRTQQHGRETARVPALGGPQNSPLKTNELPLSESSIPSRRLRSERRLKFAENPKGKGRANGFWQLGCTHLA